MDEMIRTLFDLNNWIGAMDEQVATLQPLLGRIAVYLALLGVVFGGLRTMLRGGATSVLIRTGTAALVLAATPFISSSVVGLWNILRAAASAQLVAQYDAAALKLDDIAVAMIEAQEHSILFASLPSASGITDSGEATDLTRNMNRWVSLASLTLLVSAVVMFFMLVLTGLAITVANIILPLAAGLLTFSSGIGNQWLGRYCSLVVSSLVLVALLPMMFTVAFEIGAVRPLTFFAESLQASNDEFAQLVSGLGGASELNEIAALEAEVARLNAEMRAIEDDPASHVRSGFLWQMSGLTPEANTRWMALYTQAQAADASIRTLKGTWYDRVAARLTAQLQQAVRQLMLIVGAAVLMLLCVFIAVVALLRLEGYVAQLVGGFVPGAASAAVMGVGATLAASRLMRLGRGSQESMSTQSDVPAGDAAPSLASGSHSMTVRRAYHPLPLPTTRQLPPPSFPQSRLPPPQG